MKPLIAIIVLLMLCTQQSSAKRYRAKDARAKYIDTLLAFEPLVRVGLIREGDKVSYNDSFSRASQEMHEEVIRHYGPQMKLSGIFHTDDSLLQAGLNNEVIALFDGAVNNRYLEDGISCPLLDSVATSRGVRYALLVLNVGFLRTKTNYHYEENKGVPLALATLGAYQRVPIVAKSNMFGMVLDLRDHKTYYFSDTYGTLATNQQSQLSMAGLDRQFRGLFTTFFWSAPL